MQQTAQDLINEATTTPSEDDVIAAPLQASDPNEIDPEEADDPEVPASPLARSARSMRTCLWLVVPGMACVVGAAVATTPAATALVGIAGLFIGAGLASALCGETIQEHLRTRERNDTPSANDG